MQKVLQINITCGRGSTGKLAQALYEASVREGYEARFAYSAYTPTLEHAFAIETKFQNYLRRGLNRFFGRKQSHSTPGTKRLIRYIKKERPDLIHLHNVQQNSVNYHKLFSFLKETEIPVVFTLHDCWAFTGGCFYFTAKNCYGYKTGCQDCQYKPYADDITCTAEFAYGCKSKLIGGNDRMYPVCVSKWLRDRARESYMGTMAHIPETIYNGINTELFSPKKSNIRQKLEIDEGSFVVLGVAAYWSEDRKGLPMLLELRQNLPQDVVMVLVGGDLATLDGKYENLICIEKTENQEQLAQLYSTADVFINSSLEETFGLTTVEAMACGTPAIVFDSTACPEIVDENTGIIAKHTAEDVLQAVLKIKDKGKQTYSASCVERARSCFSEKRMTEEYLALYRSLLDGI